MIKAKDILLEYYWRGNSRVFEKASSLGVFVEKSLIKNK